MLMPHVFIPATGQVTAEVRLALGGRCRCGRVAAARKAAPEWARR